MESKEAAEGHKVQPRVWAKLGGEAWEQRPQVGHATLEQKEGQ